MFLLLRKTWHVVGCWPLKNAKKMETFPGEFGQQFESINRVVSRISIQLLLFFFFSSIPYFGDQGQCLGMKLLDNLCMQVAFVTGPEERSEPLGGVPAKPYKAFNRGTFRLFLVVPFFKVNE